MTESVEMRIIAEQIEEIDRLKGEIEVWKGLYQRAVEGRS